ncbi:hypothetical protein M405DRAFT_751682 [Rhizopogon salebrosus TDB-379]|nr:hypothetical protein M405DRAFT_751682 [Rhizopogon salebrosus TDB-379]
MALKAIRRWTNRQRLSEVHSELLAQLRILNIDQQKKILRELKSPRTWIRRVDQNSIIIPIQITTLDDQCTFDLHRLLDSGATGCYVDEGLVRAKGINLEPLPRPIPVYNANGSHNTGGPI